MLHIPKTADYLEILTKKEVKSSKVKNPGNLF